MSDHTAFVVWERRGARFTDGRYSRAHQWEFDGGAVVPGSSSPQGTPEPLSDPKAVDPEEAFVAALSSCHMLWFLLIAAKRGYCIERYTDRAAGKMEPVSPGRLAITSVTLHPHAIFSAANPVTLEVVREMHEEAHHNCFIANSVNSEVTTVPTFSIASMVGP